MSILSDLLSRAKQQQPKRDVPPGLRGTVSSIKREESRRKKMFIFAGVISIFTGLGLAVVYITGYYGSDKVEGILASKMKKYPGTGQTMETSSAPPPAPSVRKETLKAVPHVTTGRRAAQIKKTDAGPVVAKSDIPEHDESSVVSPVKASELPIAEKTGDAAHKVPDQDMPAPGLKESYLYAAERYENSGDIASAASEYQKVLDLEPKNYRVMNKISFLLIKMGRFDEAERHLNSALLIRQDYVPALINAAIISASTGKITEAENYLLKALSIDPANRSSLLNLALLYEKEKKNDDAREYYSRLRRLGDKNGDMGIQRLGQVR